ncbi:MAG: cob(I)yrinic acid a,c-diamide adenosyltransferase, partial [Actinomycetota bacterium]|nr:cob(I)yrinic acid a,c-diamide adenosyltransferase [Actinomycetota bacterium]
MLVERARAGDRAAFDALAERHRATAFGAAYALLGDAHDAEDATQEALIQAWRRLADLREPDRFPGWLYRIVQNRCRNVLARSRRATVPLDRVARSVAAAEAGADTEAAEAVRAALGSLSEPQRLATTLHYVDGYSVAEVAGLLGVPVGTVKRRLHDARRRLGQSPALRARGKRQEGTAMRLFTGRGDRGETDLLGGGRVGKDDPRVAVLGALDEATSAIGLGRALAASARAKELLAEVQRDLYRLMAGLAFAGAVRPAGYGVGADRVARLEAAVDELGGEVAIPPQFVLAGDSAAGAALDVARAVVRRAEREAVALVRIGRLDDPQALRYLNRLSSVLFVLARFEDDEAGAAPL